MHQIGTVIMESNVVNTTHLVANISSLWYFDATAAVELAAGIPVSTTLTPVTKLSIQTNESIVKYIFIDQRFRIDTSQNRAH